MLDTVCQTKDKQCKYELHKEYEKNGVGVRIHRVRVTEIQRERKSAEIKGRIMRIIQKADGRKQDG